MKSAAVNLCNVIFCMSASECLVVVGVAAPPPVWLSNGSIVQAIIIIIIIYYVTRVESAWVWITLNRDFTWNGAVISNCWNGNKSNRILIIHKLSW